MYLKIDLLSSNLVLQSNFWEIHILVKLNLIKSNVHENLLGNQFSINLLYEKVIISIRLS